MFCSFPDDFVVRKPFAEITQYVAWGDRLMLSYATFEPGALVPLHNHPHEQLTVVIEGELTLTVGDRTKLMKPRDVAVVPADVMHSVVVGSSGAVAIDVFSPPREDYKVA